MSGLWSLLCRTCLDSFWELRGSRPASPQPSTSSLAAHMLGTKGLSCSLSSPGTEHSEWRVVGRGPSPEANSASGSEADTGDSHNLCVPCKGHSEWNERGQRQSEARVTGEAVQPSKLSGRPILGPKQSEEEEIAGGAKRRETGHSRDLGLWNFNVCLAACVCTSEPGSSLNTWLWRCQILFSSLSLSALFTLSSAFSPFQVQINAACM